MKNLHINRKYCDLEDEEVYDLFKSQVSEKYDFSINPCPEMRGLTLESKFGGQPYSEGETWPICGACKKPLQFIFQFNNIGLKAEKFLENNSLFVFFQCVQMDDAGTYIGCCSTQEQDTWILRKYSFPAVEKARLNSPVTGDDLILPSKIDLSYQRNLRWHPGSESLLYLLRLDSRDNLEDTYFEIAKKLFGATVADSCPDYFTRYLGLPYSKDVKIPCCPICKIEESLLFQICWDDYPINRDFGPDPEEWRYFYFFSCPNHSDEFSFRSSFHPRGR